MFFEFTLFKIAAGLDLKFKLDGLGSIFLFVVALLWPTAGIYSKGYMTSLREHSQRRFYIFFTLAIISTLGVIFSANLITLYLFYELLSFSTYPLVVHHQDAEAKSAGRKYLAYILGPSVLLVLPAMVMTYISAGTLDFTGILNSGNISSGRASLIVLMFIFGFSKSALMPFHSWLPGAMVAPTPVSSLLHAVAVVKVGVFSILRIINDIFGLEFFGTLNIFGIKLAYFLVIVASVSVLLPSLIALSQDNIKRRLAFSTIGQLAYITLGAFLLTKASNAAAAVHIAMHAFAKITLFFAAGAIYIAAGKKYISELKGLAYKMPYTFTAWGIASAGVVGLPLTGGFITKWNLLIGALNSFAPWVGIVYLLSSFLSAYYLFEVLFIALRDKPKEGAIKEAPLLCLLPLLFTAFMTVALFFGAGYLFDLLG